MEPCNQRHWHFTWPHAPCRLWIARAGEADHRAEKGAVEITLVNKDGKKHLAVAGEDLVKVHMIIIAAANHSRSTTATGHNRKHLDHVGRDSQQLGTGSLGCHHPQGMSPAQDAESRCRVTVLRGMVCRRSIPSLHAGMWKLQQVKSEQPSCSCISGVLVCNQAFVVWLFAFLQ